MLISHPIRLALLFGGRSSEYEVSLRSAATVIRGLRSPQYRLVFIGITREGQWKLFEGDPSSIPEDTWDLPQQTAPVAFFPPVRRAAFGWNAVPDGNPLEWT